MATSEQGTQSASDVQLVDGTWLLGRVFVLIALTNIVQLKDRRHPYGDEAGDIAVVLGLTLAGLLPQWFPHRGKPASGAQLISFCHVGDMEVSGAVQTKRDRPLAVVLLRSRIVLFVSRQVGGLCQHVDDRCRDHYGDHDESSDGCGIVSHASTSAFSSALL